MRQLRRIILGSVIGALTLLPSAAMAYDWAIVARVTAVESSYMPGAIYFKVDQAGGSCAAGQFIKWNPQTSDPTSNANAIFAVLLTARASGQVVTIYGSNTGCIANFVYLGA